MFGYINIKEKLNSINSKKKGEQDARPKIHLNNL